MEEKPNRQLQIGKVAFAKTLCTEWISGHSKVLLLALATLVLCVVLLFQISQGWGRSNFSLIGAQEPEVLKTLSGSKVAIENQIAQRLLVLGDVKKVNRHLKETLRKTQSFTSAYYNRFSTNTLEISQGHYVKALQEAKQLKVDLEQDQFFWARRDKFIKSGTLLYAYNLMRIAALEMETGSVEGELSAWEELVQNAGWKGKPTNLQMYDPEAYALLASNFQEGEVSLLDFIEQRKSVLQRLLVGHFDGEMAQAFSAVHPQDEEVERRDKDREHEKDNS